MAKKAPDTVVENPEVQLVKREGTEILSFVGRLTAFLTTARELETRAVATLTIARDLVTPKTQEQDAAVKDFVRIANADRKQVEDHWGITAVFSRFHKRLTAARARATDPLEEAVRIGTEKHTDFVRAEQRRVQEEADRKQREEELRAKKQRDDEIAKIEADALALEEASVGLSGREQRFVDAYLENGGQAQRAATLAGYKDPLAQASRLIASDKVRAAILARQRAEDLRQQVDAIQALPLETKDIEVESHADTAGDRGTKSAELVDEAALIAAIIEGKLGIPSDILTVKQTKLNEYARSLGPIINRWPGVRYKVKTTIV
jgi:phage terminase small subunit